MVYNFFALLVISDVGCETILKGEMIFTEIQVWVHLKYVSLISWINQKQKNIECQARLKY